MGLALAILAFVTSATRGPAKSEGPRHLIYLHGRIVQEGR